MANRVVTAMVDVFLVKSHCYRFARPAQFPTEADAEAYIAGLPAAGALELYIEHETRSILK